MAAQQHELTKHRAEGVAVVAPAIGDGLEGGLEMPRQPEHLNSAVGLGFKAAARADTVQVTIPVELQEVRGTIAAPES